MCALPVPADGRGGGGGIERRFGAQTPDARRPVGAAGCHGDGGWWRGGCDRCPPHPRLPSVVSAQR